MNTKQIKRILKKAGALSLTAAGVIVVGLFDFFDDLAFMRRHTSLCQSMSVGQARAYLAETEFYRKKHRQAFHRLKKRGWLEERKIGGNMIAVLTESGEVAAIETILKKISPKLNNGEYLMVAFDFPEVAHAARDEFRRLIKRVGFVRHQQSVWCTQKDAAKYLKRLINIMGISKWVRLYRSVEYR